MKFKAYAYGLALALALVSSDASAQVLSTVGITNGFPITLGSTSITQGATHTTISGLTLASPTVTGAFTATGLVTSADLATVTGSGSVVLATSPTLVTPALGTPASGVLTNATGLPIASGVSGLGTGVATLLSGTSSGTGGPAGTASPTFTGTLTFGSNVAGAFGTAGVNLVGSVYTQTDSTTAAGTVATAYGSVRNAATFATAANAVTITNAYGGYYVAPIAGAHTTFTNGWALGADSLRVNGIGQVNSLGIGMSPTNILDITQNQNAPTFLKMLNNNGGATTLDSIWQSNGTHSVFYTFHGASYTTSGMARQDGAEITTDGAGGLSFYTQAAQPLYFGINNSEAARFGSDGSFLVNTTTNGGWTGTAKIEVKQSNNSQNALSGYASGATANAILSRVDSTGSGLLSLYFTTTNVGAITTNGTSTTYGTTSDIRLKSDLGVASSIDVLENLKVHNFIWKANGTRDLGVFAQEAYKVKPNAVRVGGADPKKNPWQVDYSKFVPDLIVGWQNHEARLAELERKVANDDMRERLDPYAHAFCISKLCIGWK